MTRVSSFNGSGIVGKNNIWVLALYLTSSLSSLADKMTVTFQPVLPRTSPSELKHHSFINKCIDFAAQRASQALRYQIQDGIQFLRGSVATPVDGYGKNARTTMAGIAISPKKIRLITSTDCDDATFENQWILFFMCGEPQYPDLVAMVFVG
ncbi:predicted protein [Uncinocarpus reesii 1704]|uniref:Uncharacterized protein n=1 Tax=Uncinocarpus reesii (strain UAMH 1704) TaxID=336963 RepID=C4JMN4_UNCRE|nr:uncharacterized protein UREG_04092 [Uncinocarpus reesii 1704]EEP79246.1 predicted protein [Uncinocarpus reesii 1704]